MNRSSEFITNKAFFGSYPTQEYVDKLEHMGVTHFVDLTRVGEKRIVPYKTQYNYIHYPIEDRRVPSDWNSFARLIIYLVYIIKNLPTGNMIYVHCKGGHGRSGIVVACILCYMYKISPSEAIAKTTRYHSRRKEMREKWRKMGSPQTRSQKHFVSKFFEPLYIYKDYSKYLTAGFSNNSIISVTLPKLGVTFPTAMEAFRACESLSLDEIDGQFEDLISWKTKKEKIMYYILKLKFDQHPTIKKNLLSSGLRPIIECSNDSFWGTNEVRGRNKFGKMVGTLREELLMF